MTNHIDSAKDFAEMINANEVDLGTAESYANLAKAHALIAIAEQLQLANRISMKVGHFVDTLWDEKKYSRILKPEIAELLGVPYD